MYRLILSCLLVFTLVLALPSPKKHSMHVPVKSLAPRIINGSQAAQGQFPWQASLLIQDENSAWFCGGSVIGEEWILTAGHCVIGAVSGSIFTGTNRPLVGDQSTPSQFILHEEYDYDGETIKNDIGLIKLSSPLIFDENTAAIQLSNETLEGGVNVTVSGYGLTSDAGSTISQILNYVTLTTITNEACQAKYEETVGAEVVCATSFTDDDIKGICSGDSGGGLVRNADSDPVHVGVVSFVSDNGCEYGDPNGFTRTGFFRDWIQKNSGI